jgi:hypothetical protein
MLCPAQIVYFTTKCFMNLRRLRSMKLRPLQHDRVPPFIGHGAAGWHPGQGGDGYRLSPV